MTKLEGTSVIRSNFIRTGFSLIELLVVIAGITVLMALLLPAVQKIRLAADSMITAHHLKQIGIALSQYHLDYGRLPAGYESNSLHPSRDPNTYDGPNGWAWGARLLPYLEGDSTYRAINFELPCWHPNNAAAVQTGFKVFRNPAAPDQGPTMEVKDGSGNVLAVFGLSHFAANAGNDEPWGYQIVDHAEVATGPFYRNSRVRFADVHDGLSTTVFVSEHSVISSKTWVGVVPGAQVAPNEPERFPFTASDAAATLVLFHSGPAPGEFDAIHPPNYPTCHVCQPYSPFLNGANTLFGDGSVRFVKARINVNIWAAICTISRSEPVTEDEDF